MVTLGRVMIPTGSGGRLNQGGPSFPTPPDRCDRSAFSPSDWSRTAIHGISNSENRVLPDGQFRPAAAKRRTGWNAQRRAAIGAKAKPTKRKLSRGMNGNGSSLPIVIICAILLFIFLRVHGKWESRLESSSNCSWARVVSWLSGGKVLPILFDVSQIIATPQILHAPPGRRMSVFNPWRRAPP
jgi:hypothetical protein